jgi:triacylglycerol lipase
MTPIDKVQIPQDSGFELKRAMELANLLEVAYDEYEVWDFRQTEHLSEKLPPNEFICSPDFVDLSNTTVALPAEPTDMEQKIVKDSYGSLNSRWKNPKQYERVDNFWFSEWWWLSLLDGDFFLKFFTQQVGRELLATLAERVVDEQLFGFVARTKSNSNEIFVVFRGTREPGEWINNLRAVPHKFLDNEEFGDLGEVRNGFNRIYSEKNDINSKASELFQKFNLFNVFGGIERKAENKDIRKPTPQESITQLFHEQHDLLTNHSQIFITGHSLGAGLATLAALHISQIAKKKGINASINLYTFASPRGGDETFAEHFKDIPFSYRVINSEDLIQSVPLPTTQVIDPPTFDGMKRDKKQRILFVREFLKKITGGQNEKHYQHVGIPITFTKQTGTVAGNHNLTVTYREALKV